MFSFLIALILLLLSSGIHSLTFFCRAGVLEPTWARALYIDNGIEQVAFVTVDAIGSDGYLVEVFIRLSILLHICLSTPLSPEYDEVRQAAGIPSWP